MLCPCCHGVGCEEMLDGVHESTMKHAAPGHWRMMDIGEGRIVPPICEDMCKADVEVDENLSEVLC